MWPVKITYQPTFCYNLHSLLPFGFMINNNKRWLCGFFFIVAIFFFLNYVLQHLSVKLCVVVMLSKLIPLLLPFPFIQYNPFEMKLMLSGAGASGSGGGDCKFIIIVLFLRTIFSLLWQINFATFYVLFLKFNLTFLFFSE